MSYAISNTESAHLGFILLSRGPDAGDCMVWSLAVASEDIETPRPKFLHSPQLVGELQWERVNEEFRISEPGGDVVLVENLERMTGAGFVFLVEALS